MERNNNHEIEAAVLLNPLIYSERKKFIWFESTAVGKRNAWNLFCRFLLMGVYLNGFASDETEYVGAEAFHKPIVDIRQLNASEDIVFVEAIMNIPSYAVCEGIKIMNPSLEGRKCIIYGAGNFGKELYRLLIWHQIETVCFIDSNQGGGRERNANLWHREVTGNERRSGNY